ncbi:hypothetical protein IEQ34_020561 [Dendrobium chrysotoxum]|uniref:PB1 domain-containing protein n=1 Tax=Dendrobium chrysotoxum TaxID=161865 RepID=A0AAV7G2M6_DENCH|nr:hypothetical protein IEQ34_020561 [Dendrobium chrysotoxum]
MILRLRVVVLSVFLKFLQRHGRLVGSLRLSSLLQTATATALPLTPSVTMIRLVHYLRKYLHAPPIKPPASEFRISDICFHSTAFKNSCFPMSVALLNANRTPPAARIPPTEYTSDDRKVKFLCSFGGKILPRQSDGALSYVGGLTRIIAVRRDSTFNELCSKMEDAYGGPVLIYYQLPDQGLDSLVCVSCVEDMENMMEEYDRLSQASGGDRSAKLRVFLSSRVDTESDADSDDSEPAYGEVVNRASAFEADPRRAHREAKMKNVTFKPNSNAGGEGFINEGTSTTNLLAALHASRFVENDNMSELEYERFPAHLTVDCPTNVATQTYLHAPPIKPPASEFRISDICFHSTAFKNSCFPMSVALLNANRTPPAARIPPTEYTSDDRKVKFLCSFGGKILPRQSDGALSYVGGLTRIIAVLRDSTFNELCSKMEDAYGGPVRIYYQLPDQGLDSLVCVSCVEDMENMMEEYDRLSQASGGDRFAKLRVFLSSRFDTESDANSDDSEPAYGEVVNRASAFEADSRRAHREAQMKNVTFEPNSDAGGDGFINEDTSTTNLLAALHASRFVENDNMSELEYERFPAHLTVDCPTNVATQTVNLPSVRNDIPSTSKAPHQVRYISLSFYASTDTHSSSSYAHCPVLSTFTPLTNPISGY